LELCSFYSSGLHILLEQQMKNSRVNVIKWTRRAQALALICVASGLMACGQASQTSSYYLNQISDAEWTQAEANQIVFEMTKKSGTASSNRAFVVNGTGAGNTNTSISLVAGRPYVIKFVMNGQGISSATADNDTRHEVSKTTASLVNFWDNIAIEKVVTGEAEYRMTKLQGLIFPSPKDASLTTCAATTNSPCTDLYAKVYFVPVIPGSYNVRCSPHSSMMANFTVTGPSGMALTHETPTGFDATKQLTWNAASTGTGIPGVATDWVTSTTGTIVTGKRVDMSVDASGVSVISGTLAKDAKRVVRLSKTSGFTDAVEVSSDIFNISNVAWVGDKNVRMVPYGLTSVKLLQGASGTTQTANNVVIKETKYVDFYIEPKSSVNVDFLKDGVAKTIAIQ